MYEETLDLLEDFEHGDLPENLQTLKEHTMELVARYVYVTVLLE